MNATIDISSIEEGDEYAVTYKDGPGRKEITIQVTDAAPETTPFDLTEGAVACVTLGPKGPTKNEGYLGENLMSGRLRVVANRGWFPSAQVESIRRVGDDE